MVGCLRSLAIAVEHRELVPVQLVMVTDAEVARLVLEEPKGHPYTDIQACSAVLSAELNVGWSTTELSG